MTEVANLIAKFREVMDAPHPDVWWMADNVRVLLDHLEASEMELDLTRRTNQNLRAECDLQRSIAENQTGVAAELRRRCDMSRDEVATLRAELDAAVGRR